MSARSSRTWPPAPGGPATSRARGSRAAPPRRGRGWRRSRSGPRSPSRRKGHHHVARCRGSTPVSGSSSASRKGSWTIAGATLVRCRIPFEYAVRWRDRLDQGSPWPRGGGRRRARVRETLQPRGERDNSRAVSRSRSPRAGARSRSARDAGLERGRSGHAHRHLQGRAWPQSIRNIVDLPAPLGPSSAVTPAPTSKLTSETATSRRTTSRRRPRRPGLVAHRNDSRRR